MQHAAREIHLSEHVQLNTHAPGKSHLDHLAES